MSMEWLTGRIVEEGKVAQQEAVIELDEDDKILARAIANLQNAITLGVDEIVAVGTIVALIAKYKADAAAWQATAEGWIETINQKDGEIDWLRGRVEAIS